MSPVPPPCPPSGDIPPDDSITSAMLTDGSTGDSGLLADRPVSGPYEGWIYVATDEDGGTSYMWDEGVWVQMAPGVATGGGPIALDDLTDVTTAGQVNGSFLISDGTDWAPSTSLVYTESNEQITWTGTGHQINGGSASTLNIYSPGYVQIVAPIYLSNGLRYQTSLVNVDTLIDHASYIFVIVDTSAGIVTLTLEDPVEDGTTFIFKRTGANNVVIQPGGGTIDGAGSYTMNSDLESITVTSYLNDWYIS